MKLVRGNEALFALCKARWHPSSLTPTTMLEQLSQPASPFPASSIQNLLWKLSISAESSSWEEVIIPGEKMPLLWGCMQGSHSAADNLEGNTESLHEHGSASPARKADTTGTGCLQVALSLPSPLYLAQQPLPPCGNVSLCKPDGCPWVRADRSADQPGLSSHHISGYSLAGPPARQQLSGETGRVNHSWGGHSQVCSLKLSRLLQKAQGAEAALCSSPRTLAQVHGVSVKRKFVCFCSWSVLKVSIIKVMIFTSCLLFYWQLTCQEINFLPLLYVRVSLSAWCSQVHYTISSALEISLSCTCTRWKDRSGHKQHNLFNMTLAFYELLRLYFLHCYRSTNVFYWYIYWYIFRKRWSISGVLKKSILKSF